MLHYKVINANRNGEGTVKIVYRDGEGKEVSRSAGVKVQRKHFNTATGKISQKDADYVEKNAAINDLRAKFDAVERQIKRNGGHGHKWHFEAELGHHEALFNALKRNAGQVNEEKGEMDEFILITYPETLDSEISQLKALLAKKEAEQTEWKTNWGLALEVKPELLFTAKLKEFQTYLGQKLRREGTIENYANLGNVVSKFRPGLQVKDINLSLFQDFQQHLIKLGKRNSTIRENFVKFTAFYRWLAEQMELDAKWLKTFTVVEKQKHDRNVIFLTKQELADIEALNIRTKGQHRTREIFLFACYTGLRYSDMLVQHSQIQDADYVNEEGEIIKGKVLLLPTHKNDEPIAVPLKREALAILERNNYEFSRPCEVYFNQALRALCKKLPSLQHEISKAVKSGTKTIYEVKPKWQLMTSHVARKTFINHSLAAGATPLAVADYVGHADTQMIEKHYANRPALAKAQAYKILGI